MCLCSTIAVSGRCCVSSRSVLLLSACMQPVIIFQFCRTAGGGTRGEVFFWRPCGNCFVSRSYGMCALCCCGVRSNA